MTNVSSPFELPVVGCLNCGQKLECASDGDNSPNPGDVTVCLYCGHIMSFANDLRLRELTDAEVLAVAGDRRILAIQEARGEFSKMKKDRDGND